MGLEAGLQHPEPKGPIKKGRYMELTVDRAPKVQVFFEKIEASSVQIKGPTLLLILFHPKPQTLGARPLMFSYQALPPFKQGSFAMLFFRRRAENMWSGHFREGAREVRPSYCL